MFCHSERSVAKSRNLLTIIDGVIVNSKSCVCRCQIPRLRSDDYIETSLGMTRYKEENYLKIKKLPSREAAGAGCEAGLRSWRHLVHACKEQHHKSRYPKG